MKLLFNVVLAGGGGWYLPTRTSSEVHIPLYTLNTEGHIVFYDRNSVHKIASMSDQWLLGHSSSVFSQLIFRHENATFPVGIRYISNWNGSRLRVTFPVGMVRGCLIRKVGMLRR